MQLYAVLVLFLTLSAACGLKCYSCGVGPTPCAAVTPALDCPPGVDRCFSNNILGVVTKGCIAEVGCIGTIKCCKEDLCNSGSSSGIDLVFPGLFGSSNKPSVPSVLLLLVSTACITLFL